MTDPQFYRLASRALIRLSGEETLPLINDIVTADISSLPCDEARAGALLTPQGRVLFDMVFSHDGDDLLIETDTGRRDALISKLKLYRLRRAVTITADDTPVHAVIGTAENSRRDPRFAETVSRFYGAVDTAAEEAAFTAFRWQHGVFEGAAELIPEKALPLEARLDLDAGISFEKGCYIGQEVTARTRYRGLVKRSFVPVRLTSVLASPAQITAAGKDAGDLLACLADGDAALGLASVRLAFLNDPETPLEVGGEVITPFLPPRLLPLPGTDQNSG